MRVAADGRIVVEITIDPKVWWRFSDIAESLGMDTQQVIEGTIRRGLPVTQEPPAGSVEVIALHQLGYTTREISVMTQLVQARIREILAWHGLKPNKYGKRK